jgi:hypothetical protein
VPHIPHELGVPVQDGPSLPAPAADANTDSFFESFAEPQCGHLVPFHSFDRTKISLSFSQALQ